MLPTRSHWSFHAMICRVSCYFCSMQKPHLCYFMHYSTVELFSIFNCIAVAVCCVYELVCSQSDSHLWWTALFTLKSVASIYNTRCCHNFFIKYIWTRFCIWRMCGGRYFPHTTCMCARLFTAERSWRRVPLKAVLIMHKFFKCWLLQLKTMALARSKVRQLKRLSQTRAIFTEHISEFNFRQISSVSDFFGVQLCNDSR